MSASMAMLKEIFSKALECTSVAERERYVTEACGGDTALRAEVDALLRAHASAGNFLGLPAIDHFLAAAGRPCPSADTAAVPAAPADETTLAFLAPSPTPGALGRLDHYDIAAVIGRGGMGIVLKAFDQKLHRVVAVKVMVPELAASPQARKRFVREARAAAAVRHEHVIDIHAVEDAGPLPYLVMECIEGVSLEERLRRTGKLRLKEVLRIGLQIAQGLAAAHAQGLVHRDIKPANILLENGVERVKITDFGLARPVADTGMTQPGIIAGTPQFMAPEQARAGLVDRRADLFSLGSVLYMMCTGRPPFAGGDSIAVLKCVCDEQPRPVRELNLAVPGWLAALIERLHTKDPAGRCQSAAEVAERLAQGLAHVQEPALVPPPKVDTPRSVARPGPRRRAAIAIGALTLGLGAWWLAPALYRFAAGKAVLEVQTNDTQAKVIVRQGDRQVARLDLTHDAFVDLDAGDYELDLIEGRGDLCLSPTRVALARGGHQVVVVHEAPDHVGEVRRFEGHLSAVRSVAFSPTGPWLLSGSHDKTLRLWDMQSGREIRRYVGHTGKVTGIAFSPDGSRILSASDDKTIRLWDTQTAKPIRELLGHTGFVLAAAFMPDGRHALTASYDQTLRLWDLVTAETVRIFRGHTDAVWSVAITADGTRAVSGSWDETARIWNVQTGDEVGRFTRHAGRVWPVAISPDGRLAATGGSDSKIWLWELSSGKELHCLPGHDGFVVCSLGFHPNGRALLSGGFDSSVRLWDVATGAQRYRFDGHHGHVRTVTVSADGRHAISGAGEDWLPKADNAVLLWRLPQ